MEEDYQQTSVADGGAEISVEKRPNESASEAVLRGIAALKGIAENDLEILFASVEPEALDELLRHSAEHGGQVSVKFEYEGCTVLVRSDGEIQIAESTSRMTRPR